MIKLFPFVLFFNHRRDAKLPQMVICFHFVHFTQYILQIMIGN